MSVFAMLLVVAPIVVFLYAYALYPGLLWVLTRRRQSQVLPGSSEEWPTVTLTVPVYNEALSIRRKLDELLSVDYPKQKLQILVISDASTDATEEIVASYADRGVELLRLPMRRGKTAAENAAGPAARGSIIVNSDATVRLPPDALMALVRSFADPSVGCASGGDVSIDDERREVSRGESQYVGYEMWVRSLESRLGSIVGASGCFYGIRARIYDSTFPEELSRDFASALIARANGLRAVSVDDALCYVPRAGTLHTEFRRKTRTMARGLETLWRWRRMMNPMHYGAFALMLISHKLCRWLVYFLIPFAFAGLATLALTSRTGLLAFALAIAGTLVGAVAWYLALRLTHVNRIVALSGFALASVVAGLLAWSKVLLRHQSPIWEPTRRAVSQP